MIKCVHVCESTLKFAGPLLVQALVMTLTGPWWWRWWWPSCTQSRQLDLLCLPYPGCRILPLKIRGDSQLSLSGASQVLANSPHPFPSNFPFITFLHPHRQASYVLLDADNPQGKNEALFLCHRIQIFSNGEIRYVFSEEMQKVKDYKSQIQQSSHYFFSN